MYLDNLKQFDKEYLTNDVSNHAVENMPSMTVSERIPLRRYGAKPCKVYKTE